MKQLPFKTSEQRSALTGKRIVVTFKSGRMLVAVCTKIEGSYLFFGPVAYYFYDVARIVDGEALS